MMPAMRSVFNGTTTGAGSSGATVPVPGVAASSDTSSCAMTQPLPSRQSATATTPQQDICYQGRSRLWLWLRGPIELPGRMAPHLQPATIPLMPAAPRVSILMPVYNEADLVAAAVARVIATPLWNEVPMEIVAVDDGS